MVGPRVDTPLGHASQHNNTVTNHTGDTDRSPLPPTICTVSSTANYSALGHSFRVPTPPEAKGANTSSSTHRRPSMDQGSATIHCFHSNYLHSPIHPQSLGSVRSDLTSVAAATMMHSAAAAMLVIAQVVHPCRHGQTCNRTHT